jgi:beta-glucosidase-like glycosyl hydrolase
LRSEINYGRTFILEKIDDKYPASLSPKIICDILREKLNYKGIVVTDALDMKAITNSFKLEEIIKLAFLAGNDVLLMPEKST